LTRIFIFAHFFFNFVYFSDIIIIIIIKRIWRKRMA